MIYLKKQWCIGAITGQYLARLEDVLHLYSLAYDERRPVICFDELPVQLVADVVAPLDMKSDKPQRFDYEYERCGTACLLMAIEPMTGKRLAQDRGVGTVGTIAHMFRAAHQFD